VFTIYACTEEGEYENKHIKSAQNYFIHHECVHDIAEILLKVALNTKNQINQIKPIKTVEKIIDMRPLVPFIEYSC
jgi:hypothetical protein